MKKFLLFLTLIFANSIILVAKPNNVVPLGIFTETNGCMGMRLTKEIIITAAHCLTDITKYDSPIYADFKYSDTAKEWIVVLSNNPQGNNGSNASVYFHTQNFNPTESSVPSDTYGDLALIKITGPMNIMNTVVSDKNIKNLPPQIKDMMTVSLKNEQAKLTSNYKAFMNIPLENYKVFALNSTPDNKVPEFFKTMKIHSYISPCYEQDNSCLYREPIIDHPGTFQGIRDDSANIIGWNLPIEKGESGSPVLDTQNKRFFGAISGPCNGAAQTMKIDEKVCNTFLRKLGIKCEIANPPQPTENNKENKQLKPIGKNIKKPIIKPTKK